MKLITTLISSLVCLTCFANAEETTETKEEQNRTCRIIFPERLNDSPKFAHLYDGKSSQLVELPTMNFSPVISLAGGEITLLMATEPVTDPKKLPATTPKLIIPEDADDFYILVTPDTENLTLPLKMEIIILREADHKFGETLWINKTKHQISANLGESKITVAPESETISKVPLEKNGYYRAEFTYQINGEGDFKKITEQQWWHDAKSRHLGYVVDSGNTLPKIMIFRDFRIE